MTRDFSLEGLNARAAQALLREAPQSWDHSDDDMNAKARMIPDGVQPKLAAVLVPIIMREQSLTVLLTQRTAHLSNHAGQIAFPGGRRDPGEAAVDAALRETFEETGLEKAFITPLGFLQGYLTVTGYLVTPVVALVRDGFQLVPQANEVAEIFEVPFSFLMTPSNRQTHSREWNGKLRHFYAYSFEQRYIWGATAGMINSMDEMIYGQATP